MADNLPINFPIPGEAALANYSFTDLTQNIGYVQYYGHHSNEGTTLISQALESNDPYTANVGVADWTQEFNFDLEFQRPQVIDGDAIVVLTLEAISKTIDAVVEILHVSTGAVETSIGAAVTTDSLIAGVSPGSSLRVALRIPVTKTNFAIGEKFRVEIIVTADTQTGGAAAGRIYHDPTNGRTTPATESPWGGNPDSSLIVLIPFRINL